jgi:hypothetical protein
MIRHVKPTIPQLLQHLLCGFVLLLHVQYRPEGRAVAYRMNSLIDSLGESWRNEQFVANPSRGLGQTPSKHSNCQPDVTLQWLEQTS